MSKEVVLSLKNVSKTYQIGDQKIHALKNVSFDIHRGDFISIVGKSGSGKSTLMHIIGLLDTPSSGEVILNGKNVTKYEEKYLAQVRNEEIGFVFQAFNLLSRATALENVMLPLSYSKIPKNQWQKKSEEMLELVDLKERMLNKSNELSGGQKQRVAIARALINNPSIILADEPTGNLDPETSDEIMNLLMQVSREYGSSIVMATHDFMVIRKYPARTIKTELGRVVDNATIPTL